MKENIEVETKEESVAETKKESEKEFDEFEEKSLSDLSDSEEETGKYPDTQIKIQHFEGTKYVFVNYSQSKLFFFLLFSIQN